MAERRKASPPRTRKTASKARSTSRKKTATGAAKRKTAAKPKAAAPKKRWSQQVTAHSDALDLKQGVFTLSDPKRIAASLKRSAERSTRRKTGAYRSALSLTFYLNRAGKTLPKTQATGWSRPRPN